jgi:PAS domain S-box-containing protein
MSGKQRANPKAEKPSAGATIVPSIIERRVLILAPTGNDARLTLEFLTKAGLSAQACRDVQQVCDEVKKGCGMITLAEETLGESFIGILVQTLATQPSWSDIPIILITSGGEVSQMRLRRLGIFGPGGNVTVLERPFRPATLVSTVEVALRSRQRQYESRRLLEELREARAHMEATLGIADIGTWTWDIKNDRIHADKNMARIFSISPEDAAGGPMEKYLLKIHPDDRAVVEASKKAAMQSASGEYEMDYRVQQPGGALRWVTSRGRLEKDATGAPLRFLGVIIDITERKQAEAMLRQNEALFSALVDLAPTGVYVVDAQFRLQQINALALPAFAQVEPKIGRDFGEVMNILWGPELGGEITKIFRHTLATGERYVSQRFCEFRQDLGEDRAYEWETQRVTLADGQHGVVCYFNDITEQRREAHAAQQLAAIVESSADAIISKDVNGIITSWNRGAEHLFGYSAQEIVGQPVTILIPRERLNEEPNILNRIRRGERIEHYETIRQRKDGTLIEISLTVSPIQDAEGKVIGASKIARDVTKQKQAERELEQAHKEAVAASRAKDDFLAALSHELRTPLNPALLLASESADNHQLPEPVRLNFETIRKNIELEARLIDDLLDLTRITAKKMVLNKSLVDVHDVLTDAIATMQSEQQDKKLHLDIKLKAAQSLVEADAVRLQQVFWNVLKNAVKFTPVKGKITLETSIQEKGQLIIKITDTGVGMNQAELARVFTAFAQGDHAGDGGSHRFGGLGLGLAISKDLVELHSGQITAHSAGKDQGSAFTIELPLAKEIKTEYKTGNDLAQKKGVEVLKEGSGSMSVLLVEDHEITRTVLAQLLTRRNYRVVTADSIARARDIVRQDKFDLLISDIGLPDGDGNDLMSEFQKKYGLKGIALTGYGTEEDIARGKAAGFITHLIKPVLIQSLENALALVKRGFESRDLIRQVGS